MVDSSRDKNIELLTYCEVESVRGAIGNFDVTIRKKARYVDMVKCTGCGSCMEKCPTKVLSEWDLGMGKRKAIYTPFAQAVPNVPVIDRDNCIWFSKGKCGACKKVCAADAIDFDQQDELVTSKFGIIIVATGYELFPWEQNYGEYGGGRYPDVVTALHFERMLQASGPTSGHVIRPSDGKEPKNVVFIQCVGSRDESKGVPYCSGICCMYTAKQAILLREHVPDAQTYVFYMDIRATKKNYEQFVLRAQREYGAIYIRGRVSRIYKKGEKLIVKGADTLSGQPMEIEADLVVLATGVVSQPDAPQMAQKFSMPCDQFGFFTEAHPKLKPVESVTRGILLAGACQSPMDIPEAVNAGSAAAVKVCGVLCHDELRLDPTIAVIDQDRCSGCLTCTKVCPFDAIVVEQIGSRSVARVMETLCQGCGTCVANCPAEAIAAKGFTNAQIYSQIEAPFKKVEKELASGVPS